MKMLPQIQVIFFEENNHVIAQGLEVDICAWGDTKEEAKLAFLFVLAAEIRLHSEKGGSIMDIGPAPQNFFKYAGQNDLFSTTPILSDAS